MLEMLVVLLVSLLWAIFLGGFSAFNLVVGAILAMVLLSLISSGQKKTFPQRVLAVFRFIYRFLLELIVANIVIARLAFTPRPRFAPHIIAVPLRLETNAAIALLSATITLLPGTVAMGVSEDKKFLYAHAMGEPDLAKAKDSVTRMESLILGFMN